MLTQHDHARRPAGRRPAPYAAAVLAVLALAAPAAAAPGDLDPTFSRDGRQTTDFGRNDQALAVALQPDGKIVVAGESGPMPPIGPFSLALARYKPDGSLDDGSPSDTTGAGKLR